MSRGVQQRIWKQMVRLFDIGGIGFQDGGMSVDFSWIGNDVGGLGVGGVVVIMDA